MIYDCFMFFNELEVLDIRLHELGSCVDKFVLVESTKTHRGNNKPLHFNDNKWMFKEYLDRIIHIIVEDLPELRNSWHQSQPPGWNIENFQRNCITRGLVECNDNDVIVISDIDEIPRASIVRGMKKIPYGVFYTFELRLHCYFLNTYFEDKVWNGTCAMSFGTLNNKEKLLFWPSGEERSPQIFREWVRGLRGREDCKEEEIKVNNISGGILSASTGGMFSMIVKTDGTLWATGDNSFGQLGDGTTANSLTPKVIIP